MYIGAHDEKALVVKRRGNLRQGFQHGYGTEEKNKSPLAVGLHSDLFLTLHPVDLLLFFFYYP